MFLVSRFSKLYLCIILLCWTNVTAANVATVNAPIEKKESLTTQIITTDSTSTPSQNPIISSQTTLSPSQTPPTPSQTKSSQSQAKKIEAKAKSTPNVLSDIKILMKKKQLEEAKSLAFAYLKTHPDDVDVMLFLGLIYYQQSNYTEAEQAFHKVLQKVPNYLDAKLGLIRVYLAEKKYQEASDLIKQAVKQDPNNIEVKNIQISYQKAVSSLQVANKPSVQANVPPEMFAKIKILINEKNLSDAKSLAIEHLKQYPNDLDVMLLLGLIYYQQSDYPKAELSFRKVLEKTPTYLDAKLGLIRVKIAQKQYNKAADLIKEVSKDAPQNKELKEIEILYKKAIQEKKKEAIKKKKEKPSLIDEEIAKNHLFCASAMVRWWLRIYPCDPKLLVEKAKIFSIKHLYAQSAYYTKKAMEIDPSLASVKEMVSNLKEIDPNKFYGLNEIGISSLNEYVSDLHEIWNYSTFYYSRETSFGPLYTRINYAKRLGKRAPQVEFEFLPIITQDFYLDLCGNIANKPELFPKHAGIIEAYWTIPKLLTVSYGQYYAHIIRSIYYKKYTASLSKNINLYWFSMRVNHFVPGAGSKSTLFIGIIRRYFKTNDFYVNLSFGFGRSPDLADLQSVNFIVIRNRFINLGIRFPICNHRMLVDLIVDHQNWKYPSGLTRKLSGGTLGLSFRF